MEEWIKEEWISGPELLAAWKIRDFQLAEHIRAGLKPYDKRGALIQRPLIYEVIDFLRKSKADSIKKILSQLPTGLDLFRPSEEQRKNLDRYEPELRKEWAIQHIPEFLFKRKAVPVLVVAKSADDHIKQRKAEGAKVEVIACELYDRAGIFKMTDLDICRKLGFDSDLQPSQIDAMKQRTRRARSKGEAMIAGSGKRKKS